MAESRNEVIAASEMGITDAFLKAGIQYIDDILAQIYDQFNLAFAEGEDKKEEAKKKEDISDVIVFKFELFNLLRNKLANVDPIDLKTLTPSLSEEEWDEAFKKVRNEFDSFVNEHAKQTGFDLSKYNLSHRKRDLCLYLIDLYTLFAKQRFYLNKLRLIQPKRIEKIAQYQLDQTTVDIDGLKSESDFYQAQVEETYDYLNQLPKAFGKEVVLRLQTQYRTLMSTLSHYRTELNENHISFTSNKNDLTQKINTLLKKKQALTDPLSLQVIEHNKAVNEYKNRILLAFENLKKDIESYNKYYELLNHHTKTVVQPRLENLKNQHLTLSAKRIQLQKTIENQMEKNKRDQNSLPTLSEVKQFHDILIQWQKEDSDHFVNLLEQAKGCQAICNRQVTLHSLDVFRRGDSWYQIADKVVPLTQSLIDFLRNNASLNLTANTHLRAIFKTEFSKGGKCQKLTNKAIVLKKCANQLALMQKRMAKLAHQLGECQEFGVPDHVDLIYAALPNKIEEEIQKLDSFIIPLSPKLFRPNKIGQDVSVSETNPIQTRAPASPFNLPAQPIISQPVISQPAPLETKLESVKESFLKRHWKWILTGAIIGILFAVAILFTGGILPAILAGSIAIITTSIAAIAVPAAIGAAMASFAAKMTENDEGGLLGFVKQYKWRLLGFTFAAIFVSASILTAGIAAGAAAAAVTIGIGVSQTLGVFGLSVSTTTAASIAVGIISTTTGLIGTFIGTTISRLLDCSGYFIKKCDKRKAAVKGDDAIASCTTSQVNRELGKNGPGNIKKGGNLFENKSIAQNPPAISLERNPLSQFHHSKVCEEREEQPTNEFPFAAQPG